MSFTDQLPFKVEQEQIIALKRAYKRFRCAWCGYKFCTGDIARWVYTNSGHNIKGIAGNPFICYLCDGPKDEILARLGKMRELASEASEKYWFFFKYWKQE